MTTSKLSVLSLLALCLFDFATTGSAQTAPVITSITPPRQVVQVGGSLTLSVAATNATSYQWKKNGQSIPGATATSCIITNSALQKDKGWYYVEVSLTNGGTTVSALSSTIFVLVVPVVSSTAAAVWGNNAVGQDRVPSNIGGAVDIAAGDYHTVALKRDGTVVAWGSNGDGQTTVPAGLTGVVGIAAGSYHTLALKQDGMVVGWGRNYSGQATAPVDLSDVVAVAAGRGEGFSLALKRDGTVVGWGYNGFGQTTVPAGLTGVVAIAAGYSHSMALRFDGSVVAWGENQYFQAAVPAGLGGVVAIAVGWSASLALRLDGSVVAWGSSDYGQTTPPTGLSGVVAIAAGSDFALALKQDGTVAGWGKNNYGQTTISSDLNSATAIGAGYGHSAVIYDSSRDTLPLISLSPPSAIANLDDAVTLSVVVTPTFPMLSYKWRKNAVNISGATSATFSISKAAAADAGTYDVVVSNYLGSVTSAPATLTVNSAAPANITVQPSNTTANVGANVTLSFTATGSPTPAYQWFKDGTAISGATSNSYMIASVVKSNAGTYTATATNTYNGAQYRITTTPAILTVIAPPVITVQPANQVVLAGTPVTFSVSVQGLAATTYQWQKDGTAISGATNGSYVITSAATLDSGVYTAVVTNSEGSVTSNPANLVVNVAIPPAISTPPASVTIVANDRTWLKVSATGTGTLSYQWYQGASGDTSTPINGATSPTFTTPLLTLTTSYWVRVTDGGGNVTNSPAETVTISGTSPLTVSQVVMGHGYMASGAVTVMNTITYTGTAPSRIDWATLLPTGWKYVGSGGSEGGARPVYKSADLLEWTWSTVPASPIEFTYTVSVPAGTTTDQVIASLVTSLQAGTNFQTMAKPDPLVLRSASLHSADSNRDGRISLLELTRVIELYNFRAGTTRTGQYKVKVGTEDGFEAGP